MKYCLDEGTLIRLTPLPILDILVSFSAEYALPPIIMMSKLERQNMYILNGFEILKFQFICSDIYLTMLFYLLHYIFVRYRALKIAKLLKI